MPETNTPESGATQMASSVALARFLPDATERKQVWNDFFARREREREELKKVREASQVREYRDMLGERFHVDPATIQIVSKLRTLQGRNPSRCARVWYQVQVLANDLGIDIDVQNEETNDDPVFDKTTIARRQGVAHGSAYTRVSESVQRTRINSKLAEQMLVNLRNGLPARHRVGRPSNEERAAQRWAEERFDEERDVAGQQGRDLELADQKQIEQNTALLSGIQQIEGDGKKDAAE